MSDLLPGHLGAVTPDVTDADGTPQPLEIVPHPIANFATTDIDADVPVSRCVLDPRHLPPRPHHYLYTLVLDVDETLVTARDQQNLVFRPGAHRLLRRLARLRLPVTQFNEDNHTDTVVLCRAVEIVIWSAGVRGHVDRCVQLLDPDGTLIDHAICRSSSWLPSRASQLPPGAPEPPIFGVACKDLSLLPGRGASSFIVDDSPYAAVCSGGRALIIPAFDTSSPSVTLDTTLLFVLQVAMFVVAVLAVDRIDRAADAPKQLATLMSAPGDTVFIRAPMSASVGHSGLPPPSVNALVRSLVASLPVDLTAVTDDVVLDDIHNIGPSAMVRVASVMRGARVLRALRYVSAAAASAAGLTTPEASPEASVRPMLAVPATVPPMDLDDDKPTGRVHTTPISEGDGGAMCAARRALVPQASDLVDGAAVAFAWVAAKVLRRGVPTVSVNSTAGHPAGGLASMPLVGAFDLPAGRRMAEYDESAIARVLRTHPFLVKSTLPTAHGVVSGFQLDVTDASRLGARIRDFYETYATRRFSPALEDGLRTALAPPSFSSAVVSTS